jgi:RNA polymerase sigma-70 factor, ECF subfamily
VRRSTTTPRPVDWTTARQRCLREARRFVADPSDAEDVVQEALIRGWRRLGSVRSGGSRLGWMLAITRNEALRWRESPRGRREPRIDDLGEREKALCLATSSGYDGLVEGLAVRTAVAALSEDERRLLHLRYEADLTQREIAEFLGLPEGTVKVRLHRLRRRLGRELTS